MTAGRATDASGSAAWGPRGRRAAPAANGWRGRGRGRGGAAGAPAAGAEPRREAGRPAAAAAAASRATSAAAAGRTPAVAGEGLAAAGARAARRCWCGAAARRGAGRRGGAGRRALRRGVTGDPPAGNGAARAASCCGAGWGAGWAAGRGPGSLAAPSALAAAAPRCCALWWPSGRLPRSRRCRARQGSSTLGQSAESGFGEAGAEGVGQVCPKAGPGFGVAAGPSRAQRQGLLPPGRSTRAAVLGNFPLDGTRRWPAGRAPTPTRARAPKREAACRSRSLRAGDPSKRPRRGLRVFREPSLLPLARPLLLLAACFSGAGSSPTIQVVKNEQAQCVCLTLSVYFAVLLLLWDQLWSKMMTALFVWM